MKQDKEEKTVLEKITRKLKKTCILLTIVTILLVIVGFLAQRYGLTFEGGADDFVFGFLAGGFFFLIFVIYQIRKLG